MQIDQFNFTENCFKSYSAEPKSQQRLVCENFVLEMQIFGEMNLSKHESLAELVASNTDIGLKKVQIK